VSLRPASDRAEIPDKHDTGNPLVCSSLCKPRDLLIRLNLPFSNERILLSFFAAHKGIKRSLVQRSMTESKCFFRVVSNYCIVVSNALQFGMHYFSHQSHQYDRDKVMLPPFHHTVLFIFNKTPCVCFVLQ
jgi:hypothetical protein